MNVLAKVCAVICLAAPMVVAFGYFYQLAAGGSLASAMFKCYSVLQDAPGADVCNENNMAAAFVMNTTHVIGLFTYALVLAVVVDDVATTIGDFKKGNTALAESGHTVILNANRHTVPLLRQWAVALHEAGADRAPIVLMADRPKAELDEVVDELRRESGVDVMAREGRPYDLSDLEMISAASARTIIIMDPLAGKHWDGTKVPPHTATLVSLAALGGHDGQCLVLQKPMVSTDDDMLESAAKLHSKSANGMGLISVDNLKSLAEVLAQSAVQPGLANFYNSTFVSSTASTEFYTKQFESLDGKTWKEARTTFKNAVLVGYWRDECKLVLNPPEDDTLQKGDWVVGIAPNMDMFEPKGSLVPGMPWAQNDAPSWEAPADVPDMSCRRIVVLCFGEPHEALLKGLEEFLPRGARVTFVSQQPVQTPSGHFRVNRVRGHPASKATLLAAGVANADSVLLAGTHTWEDTDADIQVLSSITQLSDICSDLPERTEPLHVVASARGPLLENFAEHLQAVTARRSDASGVRLLTTDIMQTDALVAGILTQCAVQPKLAPVLKDMFDAQGARVACQHPRTCLREGESISVGELEDRSRISGHTCIGYFKKNGEMVVAPAKSTTIKEGDIAKLLIITADIL